MRVLIVTHQYFPRHVGGTEVLVRALAREASRGGDLPTVLTYVPLEPADVALSGPRESELDGVRVIELHHHPDLARPRALAEHWNPVLARPILQIAARTRADTVLFAHPLRWSIAPIPALVQAGFRVVVLLVDYWALCARHTFRREDGSRCSPALQPPADCARCAIGLLDLERGGDGEATAGDSEIFARRAGMIRASLLSAHRLVVLSRFQKEVFARAGYPEDRLALVPHAVPEDGLAEARVARARWKASDRDVARVVFVGVPVAHKGLHVLLDAAALVPDARLEIAVWGRIDPGTPYGRHLLSLAAADRRVRLMGEASPEEIPSAVAAATALACPSLWIENAPLVVKTAQELGVPVAASDLGTLAEMIDPGTDGWLIEPDARRPWADWLARVARDRAGDLTPRPRPAGAWRDFAHAMRALWRDPRG